MLVNCVLPSEACLSTQNLPFSPLFLLPSSSASWVSTEDWVRNSKALLAKMEKVLHTDV